MEEVEILTAIQQTITSNRYLLPRNQNRYHEVLEDFVHDLRKLHFLHYSVVMHKAVFCGVKILTQVVEPQHVVGQSTLITQKQLVLVQHVNLPTIIYVEAIDYEDATDAVKKHRYT